MHQARWLYASFARLFEGRISAKAQRSTDHA
jgi:hypothetical protein